MVVLFMVNDIIIGFKYMYFSITALNWCLNIKKKIIGIDKYTHTCNHSQI